MPLEQLYTVQTDGQERIWTTYYCDGEDCEWLSAYNPEGLCPVLIGDVLSGREIHDGEECSFEIVGKLGHGSYSTVWLAWNSKYEAYWALKVLTHRHSTSDNPEMRILDKLGKLDAAFFYTHEPTEREFLCLVMEPRGCSLRAQIDASDELPDICMITHLVKTLMMKLLEMHDKGVHHGDISPGNVAFPAQGCAFTKEGLLEAFKDDLKSYVEVSWQIRKTRPKTLPQRPPNLPEYIVMDGGGQLRTDMSDIDQIDFLDFGEAYDTLSKKDAKGTKPYCAPETNNSSANIGTAKSDHWSLGCVIFYGITGEHLFSLTNGPNVYFEGDYATQVSLIDKALQFHLLVKEYPEYRKVLAEIIQSLVRVDPAQRDPDRAKKLLKKLELCAESA